MHIWTREERKGGGILLYIRNEFTFVRSMNEECGTFCEILSGEVQSTNYNTTMFVIYRPPDTNKTKFIRELKSVLCRVPKKKNLVLLGDLNINILE